MESVDYKKLYKLQDKILDIVFETENIFYLTGTVLLENGYIIDNCENILANKITAVMGRDNPKEIFDIFLTMKRY